jgi:sugar phosphate isomerase/epimerase
MAEKLGADTVVVHLPTKWLYSTLTNSRRQTMIPHLGKRNFKTIAWFQQQLPFIQAETTVKIAVEIMPMNRILRWPVNAFVWNKVAEWTQFEFLTLDTTHCGTWGSDPSQIFDRTNGKVKHIHISNLAGNKQHQLPTRGKLKLDKFLQRVAASDYQGHITVETSPVAMEADCIDKVKRNLADSLAFCRKHFQRES